MSSRIACLVSLVALTFSVTTAEAKEAEKAPAAQPGDQIVWIKDLPKAFARAKEKKKILMICVNAKQVDQGRNEPAAKGLREIVYKDVRIVGKSREFVMAYLTPQGTSADYGELRAFGIEGLIVSPQHIFVHPDGDELISRHEYWPHGQGENAVKALLKLMNDAQAKYAKMTPERGGKAPAPPDDDDLEMEPEPPTPEQDTPTESDAALRKQWIDERLHNVKLGAASKRVESISLLIEHDKDGDCLGPLLALLTEVEDVHVLTDLVRGLGVNELDKAALPLTKFLKHKEKVIRANAAISLEHIGCPEAAAELRSRASREKDLIVQRHIYRALGRCGAGDAKARATLLKAAKETKDIPRSYGALVGLSYFKGDKKAASGLEKIIQRIGPPSWGRGGGSWERGTQRTLAIWALAHVGDEKSADFLKEKLIAPIEKRGGRWSGRFLSFFNAAASILLGDEDARDNLDNGLRYYLARAQEEHPWMDQDRQDRDFSGFTPHADWDVPKESGFGGGGGGPGPGGGGGGSGNR